MQLNKQSRQIAGFVCKVIALTNFEESHYVKQMMRNSAWGYLLKNTDQQSLYRAIDTVIGGQQCIDLRGTKKAINVLCRNRFF